MPVSPINYNTRIKPSIPNYTGRNVQLVVRDLVWGKARDTWDEADYDWDHGFYNIYDDANRIKPDIPIYVDRVKPSIGSFTTRTKPAQPVYKNR